MPNATPGNDTLSGTEGNDTLSGFGGDDVLSGLEGDDDLDGGADADVLDGGEGDDTLAGGDGNDELKGGDGLDHLDGGEGDDVLREGSWFRTEQPNGDTLLGGTGDDVIFVAHTTKLVIDGGVGDDRLVVSDRSFDMTDVTGIETIEYGAGSEGVGFSNFALTLLNANVAAGATLTIRAGAINNYGGGAVIDGSAVHDGSLAVYTIVEGFNGSSSGTADQVTGSAGADTIRTYVGDDFVRGGLGDDDIDTGGGFDTVAFSGAYADYTITADNVNGVLIVSGADGTDTLRGVNQLQFDDQTVAVTIPGVTLTGTDAADDSFAGGEGTDTLSGFGGDDVLSGLEGNDDLDGGADADVLDGGEGDDTLAGGDGNDELKGGDGLDHLDGGEGDDVLREGSWFRTEQPNGDTLLGGTGDDVIFVAHTTKLVIDGGVGDDRLVVSDRSFDMTDVTGIETIEYGAGSEGVGFSNFALTLLNANVAAGATLTIRAGAINNYGGGAVIDGSAVHDGSLAVYTIVEGFNGSSSGTADQVTGSAGADTIRTYVGDDFVRGGLGDDDIDTGGGFDTVAFSGAYADYTITADNVNGVLIVSGADGTDTLRGVNQLQFDDQTVAVTIPGVTLTGTDAADDSFAGGEGTDTLSGFGGDDVLSGLEGNDDLDGGADADVLDGGEGDDTLAGGDGNDDLKGGDGLDHLDGGEGDDVLREGSWFRTEQPNGDTLLGGTGDDVIFVAHTTKLVIDGGVGDDRLVVSDRSFDMTDVTGIETIEYGAGSEGVGFSNFALTLLNANVAAGATLTIRAGAINNYGGGAVIDGSAVHDGSLAVYTIVEGFNGSSSGTADQVTGSAGADTIRTYVGDDFVRGGLGDDDIDTGGGFDTVAFSGAYADYTITADNVNGVLIVSGADGTDTLRGVNQLQFDDQTVAVTIPGVTLTGTDAADDSFAGGEGTDTLSGFGGDDVLSGLEGNDDLDGGADADVLDGGEGDDTLAGGDGNDDLTGGDGDDNVVAGDGDDLIVGGHGAGNDLYRGGQGIDTVRYLSASLGVAVDLTAGTAFGSEIGNDTLRAIENVIAGTGNDLVVGNSLRNVLSGEAGDDRLDGGDGNDLLDGGAGNDRMYGGNGDDVYVLDSGTDRVVEVTGAGVDRVEADFTYTLAKNLENLSLTGEAAIDGTGTNAANALTGNTAANRLEGLSGDDVLSGLGGDDVLVGGRGRDLLTGGTGADRFKFVGGDTGASGGHADQITDFQHSDGDRIDLSLFDADSGSAGTQHFNFIGSAAFSHDAGEVRSVVEGGTTYVRGDTDGDGRADVTIALWGSVVLVNGDFILAPAAAPINSDLVGPGWSLAHATAQMGSFHECLV